MKRTLPLAALVGVLALSTVGAVQPPRPPGKFAIYGQGTQSCGVWAAERRADSITSQVMAAWITGWVSAAGCYNTFALKEIDAAAMYAWMDQYCAQNPRNDVSDGTKALVTALSPK